MRAIDPVGNERSLQAKHGLDPSSPVPLCTQIRELLRERILGGRYRLHEQMPSENELARAFGVSRITVRQALTGLERQGLVLRIHGKGTFVARSSRGQSRARVEGFGESLSVSGHATARVTGHRVMRAGPLVAVRLGLAEREEVMEMRRVRFLNEEPLSLDITCVPVATGRRLVAKDRQDRDLLPILENDHGHTLEQSDLSIEAVVAGSEVAAALAIAPGAPVLRIERVTHAAGGHPIAFELLHYRGDAFLYRLNVKRQRGGPAQ